MSRSSPQRFKVLEAANLLGNPYLRLLLYVSGSKAEDMDAEVVIVVSTLPRETRPSLEIPYINPIDSICNRSFLPCSLTAYEYLYLHSQALVSNTHQLPLVTLLRVLTRIELTISPHRDRQLLMRVAQDEEKPGNDMQEEQSLLMLIWHRGRSPIKQHNWHQAPASIVIAGRHDPGHTHTSFLTRTFELIKTQERHALEQLRSDHPGVTSVVARALASCCTITPSLDCDVDARSLDGNLDQLRRELARIPSPCN
ncbi:hypothetical protein HWV62_1126 [Athelia sp. TMB]|nr:hypothetical protein HWV62_1126 [Athelia sp. TMB]